MVFSIISRFIRPALGLGALALLWYFGWLDLKGIEKALGRPDMLVIAFFVLLSTIPIGALRWHLLLRGVGFSFDYKWTLRTTFIGQFFHTFLPGAYGGDLVRATLAYKKAEFGLSRITFSLIIDRITGLFALLILGFAGLSSLPEAYRGTVHLFMIAGCIGIVGGILVVFLFSNRIETLVKPLNGRISGRFAHVVIEVLYALRAYLKRWQILVYASLLSVLQFLLVIIALMCVGISMEFAALSNMSYIISGIWSLVANALPITPGGIGVGEAAFAQIALILESYPSEASYGTAFLVHRLLTVLVSVCGVLPYWMNKMTIDQRLKSMVSGEKRVQD